MANARRMPVALVTMLAVATLGGASAALASPKVDWDQVENIKQVATQLGQIQRRQGATKAYEFIMNCYKTHSLARTYTRYIEGCIAQDYIHTQTLALIYSRMPPDQLKKAGAPSPQLLAQAMGQRVSGTFKKYDVTAKDADAFKKLVDKHGFETFAKLVFPKGAKRGSDDSENGQEQKQDQP